MGVYTTLTTHGFDDLTVPEVGAIESSVLLLAVVIQDGKAESSAITTDVKDPVVAHELALQARIAGLEVYAPELTEGRGSVTDVVEPTAASEVEPVPLSQG